MKQILKHRLTISLATIAVVMVTGTYVAGHAYPVAFGIIWAVYAVTLAFAIVAVRRDLKNDNTLAALKTAADRKTKADLAAAAAAQQLHATIKAAILDPEVPTATIREVTGLSTARIYQINARD